MLSSGAASPRRNVTMLTKRVITSAVALPLVLVAVWFNSPVPWFALLMAAWAGASAIEFFRLSGTSRVPFLLYFGTAWTVLLVLAREPVIVSGLRPYLPQDISLLLITAAILLPLLWLLTYSRKNESFAAWAWMLAGVAYLGLLLGYFVALRDVVDGRNWVYLAFLGTFASDTAAFFTGRALGRHKLAPQISPSKTWEGSIGGLLGAALISLVFVPVSFGAVSNPLHIPGTGLFTLLAAGILVAVFGQLGDLVESLFKRNVHAKESGWLLPGHGGALDRVDSVAFAGVVVYYFVWLIR
jgi:phosphatidate cytidylyltransferase